MEKLLKSIERGLYLCEEITLKKQPWNVEIIITGQTGVKKNVWLPTSDHMDRISDYIDSIVNSICEEEQKEKDEDI